jgi:MFS family permease
VVQIPQLQFSSQLCPQPWHVPLWGLIQTYLLPFQVEDIVGQSRKQFFLSLMVTSSNVGSFFGPVWGALSDAAVGKDGRRQRRPMIVIGQILFVLACTLMALADSFMVLLLSFMLFTMTATISGAPYTVTSTAVPLEQRGLFNAIWVRSNALRPMHAYACLYMPAPCALCMLRCEDLVSV